MALRFTLRNLEYPVAVALAAERVEVCSAAITQLEAGFGPQLFIRRHAQAGRVPVGQRRVQVKIGGRLLPRGLGQMLPWRHQRRKLQGIPDQARKKNVTGAHLTGLTGGAE